MPKPSLNPDRAKQGGAGVEPGNYEVVAAKFQNIKTDFKVNQPNLVFECATLDKDGDKVRGADPVEIHFGFGAKSLEAFHPGKASSPDDVPEDMGDGVDAEGNTMYCNGDEQFNASCGALVFNTTLVKAGFPKSVLDQTWAPSYVGMKFALNTLKPKEINDKFGTRLNTKPMADGGEVTYKVCEKWLNPNYLSKSAKSEKSESKPAETNGAHPESIEEITKLVLADVAKLKAGKDINTRQSLIGFFTNCYAKSDQPKPKMAQCQAQIKKDDWVVEAISELGGVVEYGDEGQWTGKVSFPA